MPPINSDSGDEFGSTGPDKREKAGLSQTPDELSRGEKPQIVVHHEMIDDFAGHLAAWLQASGR
jgi:hypothetical protein